MRLAVLLPEGDLHIRNYPAITHDDALTQLQEAAGGGYIEPIGKSLRGLVSPGTLMAFANEDGWQRQMMPNPLALPIVRALGVEPFALPYGGRYLGPVVLVGVAGVANPVECDLTDAQVAAIVVAWRPLAPTGSEPVFLPESVDTEGNPT